jgi:hypothetical protein
LDGVAHSKLVLADISVAASGRWAGQRNGNVMYEVGLVQAVRQGTEILLIRCDKESINFDVAHMMVHTYDPADLPKTRALIARLVIEQLKQIEQHKSLLVLRAATQFDDLMFHYLRDFASKGSFTGPNPQTMGEELLSITNQAALSRLQQLGIVRVAGTVLDGRVEFAVTPFGRAVARHLGVA